MFKLPRVTGWFSTKSNRQRSSKRSSRTPSQPNPLTYEQLEARHLLAVDFTGGPNLPADMQVPLWMFIGDHGNHQSGNWSMTVGGQTITPSNPGVERVQGIFKRGESYSVSVNHVAATPTLPSYSYRAWVDRLANPTWTTGESVPSGADFFVTDPDHLFQRQPVGNGVNATSGKTATIHFPSIDLDVDSDSIAGASFKEIRVTLSANLAALGGGSHQIVFEFDDAGMAPGSSKLFRLWRKDASEFRTEADLIRSNVSYSAASLGLAAGETVSFYLEAVNPGGATEHFDPIKVNALIGSGIWNGSLNDTVHIRDMNHLPEGVKLPGVDTVLIRATDNVFSEVPLRDNQDYDEATFRFSRMNRSGYDHKTRVFFAFKDSTNYPDSGERLAEADDWAFKQATVAPGLPSEQAGQSQVFHAGWRLVSPEKYDPVYYVDIPPGKAWADVEIQALNQWDFDEYELDEKVVFEIVEGFYTKKPHQENMYVKLDYRIGSAEDSATLIDKTADIDIETEPDEEKEDQPGTFLAYQSEKPYKVTFRSLIPEELNFNDDFFTLGFEPQKVRLWLDAEKTEPILKTTEFKEHEGPFTVWLEVVSMDSGKVSLVWHRNAVDVVGYAFDSFRYIGLGIDVDIDSDNRNGLEQSEWEDFMEDHPYNFGVLVKTGVPDADQRVRVQLPKGMDPATNIKVEYSVFGDPEFYGRIVLYRGNEVIIDSHRLSELGYNSATGYIDDWTIKGEITTKIKTLIQLRRKGLKPGVIKVSGALGGQYFEDKVHYVVTDPLSIFWDILNRQEVRASLVSGGVYDLEDLPNYGLEIQDAEQLAVLGFGADAVLLNRPAKELGGFTAGLYRDYIGGPNHYILGFAGTHADQLDDWMNNFGQAFGSGSDQYNLAMRLGFASKRSLQEFTASSGNLNLIAAGHSLGGGLASAAAIWADFSAITFNAAGLYRKTIVNFNLMTGQENDGAISRYDEETGFGSAPLVTAYTDSLDILTIVQDAGYPKVAKAIGQRAQLFSPLKMLDHGDAAAERDRIMDVVISSLGVDDTAGIWTWGGLAFRSWFKLLSNVAYSKNGFECLVSSHSYYQYGVLQHFGPREDLYTDR